MCGKFQGLVYLTSRDMNRGRSAVEQLNQLGLYPRYHQLDIDDETSVTNLRDYLVSKYGGLDVIVNNAAYYFKVPGAAEPYAEQASRTIGTNYFHTRRVSSILFPILRPHARVVNVTSVSGHMSRLTGDGATVSALRKKLSSDNLDDEELCALMQDFVE